MKREIYFDNAATTPVSEEVLKEMIPYFTSKFGNAGSMHEKGLEALKVVYESRRKVAEYLNCEPNEIIFTASGTESDNLAVLGYARKNKNKRKHIIVSNIEHPAVHNCALQLKKEGFDVTFLEVDKEGLIDLAKLKRAIRKDTILVSIMYANNEIGVIQDISAIGKLCHEHKIIFHTDACQAVQYLDIDVKKLNVDLMSLNGSKINGPKGIGVLYLKKGVEVEPIIYGGEQEFGLRSGTENVPLIVGFTKALEIARKNVDKNIEHVKKLSTRLINGLLKIEETKLNGSRDKRLPNNVNISFLNIEGESIILMLNEEGICVSTGSACSSKSLEPSRIIIALGVPHEVAHSSIRFTLNNFNTEKEVDFVIEKITEIVKKLRAMSPLNESFKRM